MIALASSKLGMRRLISTLRAKRAGAPARRLNSSNRQGVFSASRGERRPRTAARLEGHVAVL
jgi:hypothetical protein